MENNNPLTPGRVVIACDATKERNEGELNLIVQNVRLRGDILRSGDTLTVLGVLHKIPHPMGYQMQACCESMGTSMRAMEEEVSKRVDMYVTMLLQSAEDCENEGVCIEVKITAGAPSKQVVLQEVTTWNATWLVLDRHLRRDLRFYLKHIPCKVALVQYNLFVEVLRQHNTDDNDNIEHRWFLSASKPVPFSADQDIKNIGQSVIPRKSCSTSISSMEICDLVESNLTSSFTYQSQGHTFSSPDNLGPTLKPEKTDGYIEGETKLPTSRHLIQKQHTNPTRHRSSDAPLLCTTCGMKTDLYIKDSMKFNFSEIQIATDDFSKLNLLGEGGYGFVYKGKLKDGQLIAAKVRKEESTQGFAEFHSELYVLSFARHKNIVMLLGYCCKANLNILVYEYICNKSLEWHLFDKTANHLEWHQRHAIAMGTAKGLRFLHEECRSPIIHRDMRPSNILLTHDFVPMLGDFGLAKWKTNDDAVQTRILGTLGYLAPEYTEIGIVSVRTDVYAFGIVLIQLISGRKVIDSEREDQQQSLRQWAEPLIERLALHELIDSRIKDSYDAYELYHMARTAYLCVQSDPEMRPSMGEVVRLLEGESDHFHYLSEQFIPHFSK